MLSNIIKSSAILLIILVMSVPIATAQDITFEQKSDLVNRHVEPIKKTAQQALNKPYDFFNGRLHQPVNNKIHHPYLYDNEWQKGEVTYRGEVFEARLLKYDIEHDYLVAMPYNTREVYPVAINRNYLTSFTLNDREFRRFENVDIPFGSIKTGYFEVMYDGDTKFLIRREKFETVDNTSRQIEFNYKQKMILFKDGEYYRVRNRLGLMYRLRDEWKSVRQYVQDNNLRFYKGEYSSVPEILEYYDNL